MSTHAPLARLSRAAAALALWLAAACAIAQPLAEPPELQDGKTFRVLALHDVRTSVRESFAADPEESAIDETTLAGLFGWLRGNGWQPVSLEQIVKARAGGAPLPPKAVLLSFDDGYASAYTKVFPLLRQFNYPAVMALVTGWMEVPPGGQVPFGAQQLPRERFISWGEAREMARSGLVEFASHSHDMHRGVQGNPQGNLLPAATTHAWDPVAGRYEDDAQWLRRVEDDLRASRALIERHTGQRVRALAWPYGEWNQPALQVAQRAGFSLAFTLDEGPNHAGVALTRMRRAYATYDIDAPGYMALLRQSADTPATRGAQRAMHVDLDYVYDADPAQQERNLSLLLDRVHAVGPRSVFLQAFADPDGDGVAEALYFPNRHLPVRADLFNRVAWQLRTRARVQVYAWMPVMGFRLPAGHPLADRVVAAAGATAADKAAAAQRYHRLSPFDAGARALIAEIYDDLGRHASFAGVLFHDDATLAGDEDASAPALRTYREWGLPESIAAIRADPALHTRWSERKTRFLTNFTLALAGRLRSWQPALRTARNLYAGPMLESQAREWLAHDYEQFLHAYDYTAVMAMPYMEQVADPQAWLAALARRAAATPLGLERTIFELQVRDWRGGQPVPAQEFARQWSLLQRLGARHLAYYPDDFLADHPPLATVRGVVSIRSTLAGEPVRPQTPPALERAPPAPAGATR